jgi:glutamyl-tRNA synthetase
MAAHSIKASQPCQPALVIRLSSNNAPRNASRPPSSPSAEQEATLERAVPLVHERLALLADASQLLRFAFTDELSYPAAELVPKGMDAARTRELLLALRDRIQGFDAATDEENDGMVRALAEELEAKVGDLLMPLRVAITGSRVSPPLFGCMRLIGSGRVAARIGRALDLLATG